MCAFIAYDAKFFGMDFRNIVKHCVRDSKNKIGSLYLLLQKFCCYFVQTMKCWTIVGVLIPAVQHHLVSVH